MNFYRKLATAIILAFAAAVACVIGLFIWIGNSPHDDAWDAFDDNWDDDPHDGTTDFDDYQPWGH